jgi:hypothetical protein
VRRQGGRAFNDPISFPTLTVRSPNELTGDASKQVAVEVDLGFSQKLQKNSALFMVNFAFFAQ